MKRAAGDEANDVKAMLLARLQKLKETRSTGLGGSAAPKSLSKARGNARGSIHRRAGFVTRVPKHAFEVDEDDHCETSDVAYDDICHVLSQVASLLGKAKQELKIYDPYYCNGAVVKHLSQRGFPNVYNKNEDFYRIIEERRIPEYDVCVTNPPFSGDHIEKLLRFCVDSNKPFFCLVPNYVYTKPYYLPVLGDCRPFYVVPNKRYEFWTPGGFRKASSQEKKTSPFLSFWYCHGSQHTAQIIKWWRSAETINPSGFGGTKLIQTLRLLPQRMMATFDENRRRLRKKQRIAIQRRRLSSTAKR